MNSMGITLGKSYLTQPDAAHVRLCCDVTYAERKDVLYYETEPQFKEALLVGRSDAFLVGMLNSAMFDGLDIHCTEPVSEQLYYQLTEYYVPTLSDNFTTLHPIKIHCDSLVTETKTCKSAVATGNSGGVDSFYTILKYRDYSLPSRRLTHLIYSNISTGDTDAERIRHVFEKELSEKKQIAKEMNLDSVGIYSNLYSFYKHPGIYNYFFTAQYVSCAYALGNLLSCFYFSSGISFRDFSLNETQIADGAYFDLFSLQCLSVKGLDLYSAGAEVTRLQKTQRILPDPCVRKHLQVCSAEQTGEHATAYLNCGQCSKCMRTMASVWALGKVDEYKSLFDWSLFEKNRSYFLARWYVWEHSNEMRREIIGRLKEENEVSCMFYFYLPWCLFKKKMSRFENLKKIWKKVKGKQK